MNDLSTATSETPVPTWTLEDGTFHDGYFGPDSMMWKVYRSRLIGLAGSRALVLQLSRPHIAQAVADHSAFEENPLPRAISTFQTVTAVVFGTQAEADAALARVSGKHRPVEGCISHATSPHWVGHRYSAKDPDSKLWVLATLADTVYVMYDRLFDPLSDREKEKLWQEWRTFGQLFHVDPSRMPTSYPEFRAYVDGMIGGTGRYADELDVDARTVKRLSKHLFGIWLSRLLATGVTTWDILPERMRHLVSIWPPFAVALRARLVFAFLRLLVRILPSRYGGDHPQYLQADARIRRRSGS